MRAAAEGNYPFKHLPSVAFAQRSQGTGSASQFNVDEDKVTVNKYTQSCGSSVSPNLEPNILKVNKDCSHLGILDAGAGGESTAKDPTS